MIKKISLILCTLLCLLGFCACKRTPKDVKHKIEYVLDGGINNPGNPTEFTEGKEVQLLAPSKDGYDFIGWFINDQKVESISSNQKTDVTVTAKWELSVNPPVYNTKITIDGPTEVKSGKSIKLTATVTDAPDPTVTWTITQGNEYATISADGTLTAGNVSDDKIVEVTATSNYNSEITNKVIITIVASEPVLLTQEMLDVLKEDKIGFEGYVNVKLYTIGLFEKLYGTYTYQTKTAMDGTYWYTEYEDGNTGAILGLYYKNNNNLACQVGVSLMNEEEYEPMLDKNGQTVNWQDAGLYNNFKNLNVDDFAYNEATGRYDYVGSDDKMAEKMISSANPYNFNAKGFSLIIEDGEIIGIYAQSDIDYTIQSGYKAIQELIVTINYGDIVEVPTINKYVHDDIHDPLQTAIDNMKGLDNYTLTLKEITATVYTTGYIQRGYVENITDNNLYFDPFTVSYDQSQNEVKNFAENDAYGYKKINDNLYNTYQQNKDGSYYAQRAYATSITNAKPSFAFAAEIFNKYYPAPDGSITYYVDNLMSKVATTLYYGVGNDINIYGIYATEGYTSTTTSFTPYVVVKDGYIVEACFYYYMGSMYGVVELEYSDFNQTSLPENVEVNFTTRNVPTSWEEHVIEIGDDQQTNALEFLKTFFQDENIGEKMPYFGIPLGDTYGFGCESIHLMGGTTIAKESILFYYDVPLDLDYTLNSSLEKIEEYLISIGFTKNAYGEFSKGEIYVAPMDVQLDLQIFVWKA